MFVAFFARILHSQIRYAFLEMPEIVPADQVIKSQTEDGLPSTEPAPRAHRTWYRTTLFNAFVIGMVGFMAPGLWDANSRNTDLY